MTEAANTSWPEVVRHAKLYSVSKPKFRPDRNKWYVVYRDPITKARRQATFDNESDAWAFYMRHEDIHAQMRRGSVTDRQVLVGEKGLMPIEQVLAEYHDDMLSRSLSPAHIKEAHRVITKCIEKTKWKNPKAFNRQGVTRYLRPFSPRTGNIYLRTIKAFSRWMHANAYLVEDPLQFTKFKREGDEDRHARALSFEEFERLIECPQIMGWRRLWYWIAGRAGFRHTEIARLQWHDIDLETGWISIPASKSKNGQAATVPIPDNLCQALLAAQGDPVDLVFSKKPRARVWLNDLKRAEIPFKTSAGAAYRRSLRKTFGTHLAAQGVPLATTVKLMRHSDPKLTANLYTDPALLDMRGAVNSLGAPGVRAATKSRCSVGFSKEKGIA